MESGPSGEFPYISKDSSSSPSFSKRWVNVMYDGEKIGDIIFIIRKIRNSSELFSSMDL